MTHSEKRDLILNGNIHKALLTLAFPIMLNNLIHTFYNLTDTFFLGKIEGNPVAGVQLVWPVVFVMISFGIGMSVATAALIAQYIGAGDLQRAGRTAGQALTLMGGLSVVLAVVGVLLAPWIIRAMGGEGTLYEDSYAYLSVILMGLPTQFMMNVYGAIRQGEGDTVSPLIIGGIAVVTNIVLDPIFIFVLDLGVRGAAIATVLSTGFFAAIGIWTCFRGDRALKLSLNMLGPDVPLLKHIVTVGLPSSLGQTMTGLGFGILNRFLLKFGTITLTAFAVGNRISSLLLMPAMGIGSALATVVGQNIGAENITRAQRAVRSSLLWSTVFLVFGGLAMFPFAREIVGTMNRIPEVVDYGTEYLKVIIIGLPLMGIFQTLIGVFQGSGHTLSAMILMMGRLWALRIPMVFFLTRFQNFGVNAIWTAMILSNAIICVVGFIIYLTGRWKRRVIRDAVPEADVIPESV